MTFYRIENGVVVGWMMGSDIPGDPSSTKARMDAWVAEKPGERAVKASPEPAVAPSEELRLDPKGQVVRKAQDEIDAERKALDDERAAKQAQVAKYVTDVRDKMVAGDKLTHDEAEFLLGQKRDLFPKGYPVDIISAEAVKP